MQSFRNFLSSVFSKEGYFPQLFAAIVVCSLLLAANETMKSSLLNEQIELLEKQNGILQKQLAVTAKLVEAKKKLCLQSQPEADK